MDQLLKHYNIAVEESDEFEAFKVFYLGNITPIEKWYKNQCTRIQYAKNMAKSQKLRDEGNKFFKKGMWQKCVKYYTKALNFAEYDSKEYAVALANRSAALFSLEDYENCIKDIDQCLNSMYPKELFYKIYIRKAECCNKLGILTKELLETAEKVVGASELSVTDKETHFSKLRTMTISESKPEEKIMDLLNCSCKFKENPNFAYASNSVTLCNDMEKGRIVKARERILQGEILFLEKAFIFAPVFDSTKRIVPNKCFNCLADMVSPIPCKTCAMCQYCSNKCRDDSWEEFHKWECKGMTINLFYELGIAYPALRSLVKGVRSKFAMPEDCERNNFGSKEDNYPYFNTLLTNLEGNPNYTHFLIMSTVLILYLKEDTDFFKVLKEKFDLKSDNEIIVKCGGLLVRHMAQLSCNSSVLDHWNFTPKKIPTETTVVACAIFPAVSMMNHSCKTNIAITYDKDVAIVKALHDIEPNEEICNSYGVDYRFMKIDERQEYLRRQYNFDCRCKICSDPLLEFEIADSYMCPNCEGPLNTTIGQCYFCKKYFKLEKYKQMESEVDSFFEKEQLSKEDLDKCYSVCKKIFTKNHLKIADCLDLYCTLYKTEGNFVEMMSYFNKLLAIRKVRYGCTSRNLVMFQIETLNYIMQQLKTKKLNKEEKKLLEEVNAKYHKAFDDLKLYFSDDVLKLYYNECINK